MSRPACARCQRPLSLCLCALIPSLSSHTRILLLQHPSERRHPLNTARLAALGLANAQLEIGETFADLPRWLAGHEAWLLFPCPEAVMIDRLPPASTVALSRTQGPCSRGVIHRGGRRGSAECIGGTGPLRGLAGAFRSAHRWPDRRHGRRNLCTQSWRASAG